MDAGERGRLGTGRVTLNTVGAILGGFAMELPLEALIAYAEANPTKRFDLNDPHT